MRISALFLLSLLAVHAPRVAAYPEPAAPVKAEPDTCVSVPITPEAAQAAARTNQAAAAQAETYHYYADTPEEMVPYRNLDPYYRYWLERLPFRGPGRDYPDPVDLKSLKVGLLSPAPYGPEGARGERTRKGVLLAFEEENAMRQPGQIPFEVIAKEDAPLWGSAANITVEFKDNDVLGILGTIDGDATHVALRATLKLETYIINTSDPDPTLTETQVPWLTRVFPEDRQQCFRLADMVVRQRGCKRIAVLRESSRPGRVGVMHFVNDIRRLGSPAVAHLLYKAGDRSLAEQIAAIKAANPDAVLFYGQPADVGFAAAQLRQAGITAQYFGFDRLMEGAFVKNAGDAAEGMTITYFFNPERTDKPWVEFLDRFQKRWGEKPDIYAAYGYDGAKLMIEAVNKSGPNRFRIRDYLANLDSWDGVTGHMVFDARWDNIAPFSFAQYQRGKWLFQPAPAITRLDKKRLSQGMTAVPDAPAK
jgi:branched-chain amino acid transport system substrate-binding protein